MILPLVKKLLKLTCIHSARKRFKKEAIFNITDERCFIFISFKTISDRCLEASEFVYYKNLIRKKMKFAIEQDEFNPILYHLQKRNLPELIRIMFNRKLSEEYLERYGQKIEPPLKRTEESRLQDYVRRFNEIVHLKGSHPDNDIKEHVNTFLEEYFRRKLRKDGLFAPQDRRQAWLQLTAYYQSPQLFEALDELQLAPSIIHDIKKDVDRTFLSEDLRANLIQQQRKVQQSKNRVKLTKILESFVKYNPFVAYCQGMNILVQFFLQEGFTQKQSFFLLKKITEQLLPCDYHSTMNSITALLLLLCQVIACTHPQAVKQIKLIVFNNGGQGISYVLSFAFQWFVCLFTNSNIKRDIRRCIFDHYMLQGLPALLKASLCFFDVIQPGISNTKHFEQFNPLVQKIIRQFNDLHHLKHRFNETYINKNVMELLLNKLITPPEKRKKRECKATCDRRWTMCIQTMENNIVNGYSHDFFVFRTLAETKVIENYLEDKSKNKNYFCIRKQKNKIDHLLVGRMEHSCRPLSGTSLTQDLESNKCSLGFSADKNNQQSPRSKKSDISKIMELDEPQKKELIRNKALQQLYLQSNTERESMMMRSESIQFMRHMIQNESFTNLLQILQVQNMNDLFKDCISEVDEDQENNL